MATTHYPIRAVSRLTGLSADTLRAWERRYGVVVPERDDRGRVYTARHVSRLQLIAALVERGHAIGSIARLSDAELRRLAPEREPQAAAPSTADLLPLVRAAKHYDLPTLEAMFNRYALLLPPESLIFGVVLPGLREMGARWESGSINPAQEHLVSSIIRGVLGGLLRAMPRAADGPRIVFAAPAGERHELGLLCAAVLAAASGHTPIYLGPDLPAADIAHAVRQSGASTLVLAATVEQTGSAADLGRLRQLPASIDVWVGGARADQLRSAIGSRATPIDSLEDLRRRYQHHA